MKNRFFVTMVLFSIIAIHTRAQQYAMYTPDPDPGNCYLRAKYRKYFTSAKGNLQTFMTESGNELLRKGYSMYFDRSLDPDPPANFSMSKTRNDVRKSVSQAARGPGDTTMTFEEAANAVMTGRFVKVPRTWWNTIEMLSYNGTQAPFAKRLRRYAPLSGTQEQYLNPDAEMEMLAVNSEVNPGYQEPALAPECGNGQVWAWLPPVQKTPVQTPLPVPQYTETRVATTPAGNATATSTATVSLIIDPRLLQAPQQQIQPQNNGGTDLAIERLAMKIEMLEEAIARRQQQSYQQQSPIMYMPQQQVQPQVVYEKPRGQGLLIALGFGNLLLNGWNIAKQYQTQDMIRNMSQTTVYQQPTYPIWNGGGGGYVPTYPSGPQYPIFQPPVTTTPMPGGRFQGGSGSFPGGYAGIADWSGAFLPTTGLGTGTGTGSGTGGGAGYSNGW